TEELRVIGDGREVEGPLDEMRRARLRLVCVGQRDRRATAGVVVGPPWVDARPEDVGVRREAGMDVEVAEVRRAQRVGGGAGSPRLGALPGNGRGDRREDEGKVGNAGTPPHVEGE